MNSRRQAAFAVARFLTAREFPERTIPDGPDRAFVQDLAYLSVRRLATLRRALSPFVRKWPKGEMEALLLVGAAQILFMDAVPDYAAVGETVEAAKACGAGTARAVNGILRNLARNRAGIMDEMATWPLADRESYPEGLVRRWTARYGAGGAEALAKWHNLPAKTFLVYKPGSGRGIVELERGIKVADVPGYASGDFIVQDPGASIPVELLTPAPGEKILDACAAPGGKTVRIAWAGADVVACEVNPARRRVLEANMARTGVSASVVPSFGEAAALVSGGYDKVLVDAPCSNTGVLRRRPDARWNWSEKKLKALVRLQSEILSAVSGMVRKGGLLVYSTCSCEPEENAAQAEAFAASHPDFEIAEMRESVPPGSGCDGSFAAALRRKD